MAVIRAEPDQNNLFLTIQFMVVISFHCWLHNDFDAVVSQVLSEALLPLRCDVVAPISRTL